jgi:hypothetical protein
MRLFSLARARYPNAVEGLEGVEAVEAALAQGLPVIGARMPAGTGDAKVDLLLPTPNGRRLVVLGGAKHGSGKVPGSVGVQLAAVQPLGVDRVAVALFVDGGAAPEDIVERWGPPDVACAALVELRRARPQPRRPVNPEPPAARPSRRACAGCPGAPECADAVPGWGLHQLAHLDAADHDAWLRLGVQTAAEALRLAPPESAKALRLLQAEATGAPVVPARWPAPLADLPEDAVAIDLEGWDPPLTPWPSPRAFPRHVVAVAVARRDRVDTWLAEPGRSPDADAADALIRLTPPAGPLLVWGPDDAPRVHDLARRIAGAHPDHARALQAIAGRLVDVSKRFEQVAWPGQRAYDLSETAAAATGEALWAALPPGFDPMRALHTLLTEGRDDPEARSAVLAYCATDAAAVLRIVDAGRGLRP